MSTSTVLRVKRRLEDNPQDALVILCKRMKTDTEEISPSLFVFRGSVENQESSHVNNIAPITHNLKSTSNVNDIIQKIRKERKDAATASRYEIVNCSRGITDDTIQDDIDIIDLLKKDENENEKCIYDLYTAAKEDFDISMLDTIVGIENYETDLVFGSYRDNGLEDSEEESIDSNAENNWRNEYPDSEPSSIDVDDMVRAVENINLEDDLSSDTGEDKIYEEPSDLFNEDVKRYGEAYAKYKARVLAEEDDLSNSNNFVHCTVQKNYVHPVHDSYKEDSDDGFYYGQEEDSEQFKEQYGSDESESDAFNPD